MTSELVHDDLLRWLYGNQWQSQNGFMTKAHAVFADPPYFLGSISKRFGGKNAAPARYGKDGSFGRLSKGFMGKSWDGFDDVWSYQAWVTSWAEPLLDFVYPGALLAMFGGTRTYHRLAAGLEDAGWEIFDEIIYLYGSGFPKAHTPNKNNPSHKSALKPAHENIVLARAPRGIRSFFDLTQQFGTGALNIDGGRIGEPPPSVPQPQFNTTGTIYGMKTGYGRTGEMSQSSLGRYPANLILDEEAGRLLDDESQRSSSTDRVDHDPSMNGGIYGWAGDDSRFKRSTGYQDKGGASRFFYCAKSSNWEREAGLADFAPTNVNDGRDTPIDNAYQRGDTQRRNIHPTVKPIQLCEYIAKLLLPPPLDMPRRVLVPFAGVGSEMIGCQLAGWDEVTGIEMTNEYIPINEARRKWWSKFQAYEQAAAAYRPSVATTDDLSDLPLFAERAE